MLSQKHIFKFGIYCAVFTLIGASSDEVLAQSKISRRNSGGMNRSSVQRRSVAHPQSFSRQQRRPQPQQSIRRVSPDRQSLERSQSIGIRRQPAPTINRNPERSVNPSLRNSTPQANRFNRRPERSNNVGTGNQPTLQKNRFATPAAPRKQFPVETDSIAATEKKSNRNGLRIRPNTSAGTKNSSRYNAPTSPRLSPKSTETKTAFKNQGRTDSRSTGLKIRPVGDSAVKTRQVPQQVASPNGSNSTSLLSARNGNNSTTEFKSRSAAPERRNGTKRLVNNHFGRNGQGNVSVNVTAARWNNNFFNPGLGINNRFACGNGFGFNNGWGLGNGFGFNYYDDDFAFGFGFGTPFISQSVFTAPVYTPIIAPVYSPVVPVFTPTVVTYPMYGSPVFIDPIYPIWSPTVCRTSWYFGSWNYFPSVVTTPVIVDNDVDGFGFGFGWID